MPTKFLPLNKCEFYRHFVSTETLGVGEAGERVPGLAAGDLPVRQRSPGPPVPRHHACLL